MNRLSSLLTILAMFALPAVIACSDDQEPAAEVCNNGIDDDNDGLTDCSDPDCAGTCPSCGNGTCEAGETHETCPGDCP
jgi:hypothetical protein